MDTILKFRVTYTVEIFVQGIIISFSREMFFQALKLLVAYLFCENLS